MNNGPFQPVKGNQAWYGGDSGDDITEKVPTTVITPVPQTLIYSEGLRLADHKHTPWVKSVAYPMDTPGTVLGRLDAPLMAYGQAWTYMWYCHLSALAHHIRDGIDAPMHVGAGHIIGQTGWGRGVLHLHFGILLARAQNPGEFMPPHQVAALVNAWAPWLGQNR